MNQSEKIQALKALKQQMENVRPQTWERVPDLDLYMDQIISYMQRQHIGLGTSGDETLTSAMVNNYVKHGLLPRAKGKKYNREHIGYLTAICLLKQVLSVGETGALLEKEMEANDIRSFYDSYTETFDRVFQDTAAQIPEDGEDAELVGLALDFAVESYAKMLACKRILQILSAENKEEK